MLDILVKDEALMANEKAKTGIEEMGILFTYLEAYGVADKVGHIVHRLIASPSYNIIPTDLIRYVLGPWA